VLIEMVGQISWTWRIEDSGGWWLFNR